MRFLAREKRGDGEWARYIDAAGWFEAQIIAMSRGWFLDGEFVDEVPFEGE